MKLKLALAAITLACSTAAQAGPGIVIQFGSGGGGCNQRPVYCPPRPVYYQQRQVCQPYYQPPVVYYNQGQCSTGTRFSNVSGFVNGRQGVIQVSQPIYPVQPVNVYRGNNFRWR